jgi:phytoene/squalene synthetase
MTKAKSSRSGKTHREENFPVASLLVRAEHRPVILAFYYFVRAADDVADEGSTGPGTGPIRQKNPRYRFVRWAVLLAIAKRETTYALSGAVPIAA